MILFEINGSVQDLPYVPKFIKEKYKIVWEIPMKHIIEMAADRGAYVFVKVKV